MKRTWKIHVKPPVKRANVQSTPREPHLSAHPLPRSPRAPWHDGIPKLWRQQQVPRPASLKMCLHLPLLYVSKIEPQDRPKKYSYLLSRKLRHELVSRFVNSERGNLLPRSKHYQRICSPPERVGARILCLLH